MKLGDFAAYAGGVLGAGYQGVVRGVQGVIDGASNNSANSLQPTDSATRVKTDDLAQLRANAALAKKERTCAERKVASATAQVKQARWQVCYAYVAASLDIACLLSGFSLMAAGALAGIGPAFVFFLVATAMSIPVILLCLNASAEWFDARSRLRAAEADRDVKEAAVIAKEGALECAEVRVALATPAAAPIAAALKPPAAKGK